jgi:hypothetical protein
MSSSFSYKVTTENEQFTFDYSTVLTSPETINSATCTVEVVSGTDSNPSAILVGTPVINGFQVAQRIYNGLDGVIYRLKMTATTSLGNVYVIIADLQVLSPANV